VLASFSVVEAVGRCGDGLASLLRANERREAGHGAFARRSKRRAALLAEQVAPGVSSGSFSGSAVEGIRSTALRGAVGLDRREDTEDDPSSGGCAPVTRMSEQEREGLAERGSTAVERSDARTSS
jgi:hypothetical protein